MAHAAALRWSPVEHVEAQVASAGDPVFVVLLEQRRREA